VKTVLVVDDEADAVEFVKAVLEDDETKLVSARDGELGLKAAREQRPDLVVLDVQMPKKDGFAVFGELMKNPDTADIKVIMLTGVQQKMGIGFSADDMGEYLGKEPDAYVEKPIDPEAFKRVVQKVTGTE